MSVQGIGNDILVTSRMLRFVHGGPKRLDRIARRMLHPEQEIPQLRRIIESEKENREQQETKLTRFLASTWAAKEAMYKSLSHQEQKRCQFNQWYRTKDEQDRRIITCDSYITRYPKEKLLLSVSHDGDYTTAFVVRTES